MDDGLNIDDVLRDNTEWRQSQPQPSDPTGSDDIDPILLASKQIMNAARLAGFTEDQSFQFARDFFLETYRMSIHNSQE